MAHQPGSLLQSLERNRNGLRCLRGLLPVDKAEEGHSQDRPRNRLQKEKGRVVDEPSRKNGLRSVQAQTIARVVRRAGADLEKVQDAGGITFINGRHRSPYRS